MKKNTMGHPTAQPVEEFLTESKVRQTYRAIIRRYDNEGKDTSRLRTRLEELERPLWDWHRNRNGKG